MNGTAHAAVGAAAGFIVANTYQTDLPTSILLIGIGGISGLIPDLDVDGKLRNKITLSHKVIKYAAQLISILLILYSFLRGVGSEKWMGIAVGVIMFLLSSFIKQRHMLVITGGGVIIGGFSLHESWLILLGIYMIIASFVSHRSYTHSILGIIFYGFIAVRFEESLGINGVYYACLAGYISHLVFDMKVFPFNKRGIKLFLPFTSKEI
ncbi:metal-dependent hydrolase [Niallia sp. XMNu-256]|uniref:metal-dependent hydrolase n=1 Tax=Niallia sp. XMNu-256 TaxID=3082444 RepID=UPI0030CFCEC3